MLGSADNFNGIVSGFLQLGIRVHGQGISSRLDPLGKVRILKDKAIELVRLRLSRILGQSFKARVGIPRLLPAAVRIPPPIGQLPRRSKIVHTIAGSRPGDPIIERLPLVGNHLPAYNLLLPIPERVRDRKHRGIALLT